MNQSTNSAQPRALWSLCLVELFERLAASALFPLFAIYLHERCGLAEGDAIAISSSLLAATYLSSVPAGYLADHYLSAHRASLLGLTLLVFGYSVLALDRLFLLWPALMLLTVGMGLFRTGITAALAALYEPKDPLRDEGFGWFYLAVNVGYVCGPLLAEGCRAKWGWSAVLLLTMLAMSSGLVVAMFARGHLSASRHKPALVSHADCSRVQEKQRLHALVLVCGLAVVFFMAIQHTGGPLALFAQDQTARLLVVSKWSLELRPGHYATLHGLFVLLLLPLLNRLSARLRSHRCEPSTAAKLAWGFLFTTAAFGLMIVASSDNHTRSTLVSPYWLVGFYFLLSVGELLLSPMGLSLVTGLAPAGRAGRMVGWWYASGALGYWVAGAMGWLWSRWPHRHYFALVVAMLMIAAGVLASRLRSLDMALRSMQQHKPK